MVVDDYLTWHVDSQPGSENSILTGHAMLPQKELSRNINRNGFAATYLECNRAIWCDYTLAAFARPCAPKTSQLAWDTRRRKRMAPRAENTAVKHPQRILYDLVRRNKEARLGIGLGKRGEFAARVFLRISDRFAQTGVRLGRRPSDVSLARTLVRNFVCNSSSMANAMRAGYSLSVTLQYTRWLSSAVKWIENMGPSEV